jgi:hypothetical protein
VLGVAEVAEIGPPEKSLTFAALEVGCDDPVAWHYSERSSEIEREYA